MNIAEEEKRQIAILDAYIDGLMAYSALATPVDGSQLKTAARQGIWGGDTSESTFQEVLRKVHLAVRQGHQSLHVDGCDTVAYYTKYGVCGRPNSDNIVVTTALANNALGLSAGDVILAAGGLEKTAMFDSASLSLCATGSSPSASHYYTEAAASFFGTLEEGTELTVLDSKTQEPRKVIVPAAPKEEQSSCTSPLDFSERRTIAYKRDDGVAVVRIPRFYIDENASLSYAEHLKSLRDEIATAFDSVKDSPYLIWDARGNLGGLTQLGLEIVAGMPDVRETQLSYCISRIPFSDPPQYEEQPYAAYSVAPGGGFWLDNEEIVPPGTFSYRGKVAVLIDGLMYSAADYFAFATKKATDALLVGTPTAGAFGASGPPLILDGPPRIQYTVDPNLCVDAQSGQPLEGHSVEPDIVVEYSPEDLRRGRDTVLETAVSALKSR